MTRRRTSLIVALASAVVLIVAAACGGSADSASPSPSTAASPAATRSSSSSSQDSSDTVSLVKDIGPSVVHIASTVEQNFFGQVNPQKGVGTGFLIDDQGHIVTNNHVVTLDTGSPADKITVALSDGREFQANIVGRDPPTDLAVLKISADNLKPAKLGQSSDLQVGEDVVAIGNALDLPGGPTVTKGVVSALNRVIEESGVSIPDAIQTDAAINPGNSGGPLLNMNGEVVGITTAVIGNAEGIGLAISIDSAKPIVDELVSSGKVQRGFLGIRISPLDSFAAANCGAQQDKGVLITGVETGQPAADGGLRQCDVITKIGEVEIDNTGDLFTALTKHRTGEKVSVEYIRDGNKNTTDVTLG